MMMTPARARNSTFREAYGVFPLIQGQSGPISPEWIWGRDKKRLEIHIRITMRYLEGHEDLVSRLKVRITMVTVWVVGVINLLTKSPDPPSKRRCNSLQLVSRATRDLRPGVQKQPNPQKGRPSHQKVLDYMDVALG